MAANSPTKTPVAFLKNPFSVKSPEELTREQIVHLFVPAYTRIEAIKERKHTFIWGARGSGKSMMLRYLEPVCQSIAHGGLPVFLTLEDSFLAIYCPCKEGQLNKSEFRLLDPIPRLIIAEHLLNLTVATQITRCLREQFADTPLSIEQMSTFTSRVASLFDKASVAASLAEADSMNDRSATPLLWLESLFSAELVKVARYLRSIALAPTVPSYVAATTGYHDFLQPLVRATRALFRNSPAPIYLLLDDADHLLPEQQQIINTWIANRDQRDLCIKVSSRREGYTSFSTRDGVLIDEVHDYSAVDVDELYTQSKSDYAKKVVLIANRRLDLAEVLTKDIEKFLPPDPLQTQQLNAIRVETSDEWTRVGNPGRQSDFVTRYAMARLFQKLKASRQRRNYAGFDNIVHISSGVVRDFLEPCYLMFSHLLDEGKAPAEIEAIPPAIQDEILFRFSEEFLVQRFVNIRRASPPEACSNLTKLETLISSFGKLFYERLHDPEAREARLFSFTIRGQVPEDLAEVLHLGVEHRYFQLRSYSTKEGGGREKWYILNRRLCPAFKLDPTGFEGRISVTVELLRLACENSDRFVRLRLGASTQESSGQTVFSLQEETS